MDTGIGEGVDSERLEASGSHQVILDFCRGGFGAHFNFSTDVGAKPFASPDVSARRSRGQAAMSGTGTCWRVRGWQHGAASILTL